MWKFKVPIRPAGKQRATGRGPRRHTPPKTRQAERDIAMVAMGHMPHGEVLEGPLGVEIVAHREARDPYIEISVWRLKDAHGGDKWDTRTPDLDNVVKLVLDALKGHWVDDRQVCEIRATKHQGG